MSQFGFYYDAENCIGCHTCQIACKDTHRLQVGENFRTVNSYCTGSGFTPRLYHISLSCSHCAEAACMQVCTTQALIRNKEGLVIINPTQCNGCAACIQTCPYHALIMLSSGIAGKCDGCIDLRSEGELPACVASCPQRVLEFGDIAELRKTHAGENLGGDAAPLPPSARTQPHLLMRTKDCMDDFDFDKMIM